MKKSDFFREIWWL